MAGHDDEAALTSVLEEDLAEEFPWASDDELRQAAALISGHMAKYRDDDSFTAARLMGGIRVGRGVARIVGRPEQLSARSSETTVTATEMNVTAATTVWRP